MKKSTSVILSAVLLASVGLVGNMDVAEAKSKPAWKISWENKNVQYKHFTDLGNYLVLLNDVDVSVFEKANSSIAKYIDRFPGGCTATVKKNSKGQVVIGRNMDIEISQMPAFAVTVVGGKYKASGFHYFGTVNEYRYDQLKELDEDEEFLNMVPFLLTDVMNEKGLFIEANMRDMDDEYNFYCDGSVPKPKGRASMLSAMVLAALNCATVPEVVEYLNNSYSWYTLGFDSPETVLGASTDQGTLLWNLACIVGDAKGNYGLIEFAKNKVYYIPYANGQGNYYIHPELNAYQLCGCGYGRFAAALKGLEKCETEYDMMENMKECMWKREILDPGVLGYDDFVDNINDRRRVSEEEMKKQVDKIMLPLQAKIKAYYAGDEKPLRDDGSIWTTGFNMGINCAKKHVVLRLWEREDVVFEYQF